METHSIDRFAATLRYENFSDGAARTMRPDASGALSVNITALTAQEQGLARAALREWSTITGVSFTEVTGGAKITFSHEGTRANTSTSYSGSEILNATVVIGASRVDPGDTIGSYVFRTYMHEVGHALGLGHPQDYSVVRDFASSAIANDSWQMSLMSYFDQDENTVIRGSVAYNLTPMIADYLAIRQAYGATAVHAGDTVYGVGSTAGGALDRVAAVGAQGAFLIADTAGYDRVSFAGFAAAQRIDLRPGAISDVMGAVGNMQIALDTVIEEVTGGTGADQIFGNAAANRLTGGGGADVLTGLGGNDTYVVDGGDRVVEAAGGGIDTVLSSVSFALGAEVEHLTLTGTAVSGIGNALANRITGNGAANLLDGGAGNDTLIGGAGNDVYQILGADAVIEAAGGGTDQMRSIGALTLAANVENGLLTGSAAVALRGNALGNRLDGNAAANAIAGYAGNDTLAGGAGRDTLWGGAGDDLYVVETGDVIGEVAGEGYDVVLSATSYALGANVERLVLTGSAAINGIGNATANTILGNAAANTLIGGAGADTMHGGAGNDVFDVTAGDVVVEAAGGGTDTMRGVASFALAAEIESGQLTGSAAANLWGNGLGNNLIGNGAANGISAGDGNDTLQGGAGLDTLWGGFGDDMYVLSDRDVILEAAGAGTDSVFSAVSLTLAANLEQLGLVGTAAIDGTGNDLANLLRGNAAANRLDGGLGNDTLTGGAGADAFVFAAGDDRVTDFVAGTDDLLFDASALGVATRQDVIDAATDTVNGVLFTFGADSLLVVGRTLAQVSNDIALA